MTSSLAVDLDTADATVALGRSLGAILRAGDLVVLTGELGAGKTTLTRGIGEALDVRGPITSPTFVIARRHPSNRVGPALVHVDAYRLGSSADIDDLDLELDGAVTVVEWGAGRVEHLADSWLLVELREQGDGRQASIRGRGRRWEGMDLSLALRAIG